MIKKSVVINTSLDLESRPIAHLVQEASQYNSQVFIEMNEKKVNAKSIMGMMSLRLVRGEELVVVADGTDEGDAIKGMEEFLTSTK